MSKIFAGTAPSEDSSMAEKTGTMKIQLSADIGTDPTIEVWRDRPVATSMNVAKRFGKRHADVMRLVKKLVESGRFTERNFALSEYTDSTGRRLPMYLIDRHGFSILAMGFTGDAALDWKIRYDLAFERMATELMNRTVSRRDYLPGYHQLHETVDRQAVVAQEQGSSLTRAVAHSNVNRMLNSLFGIEPGQRESLSSSGRSIMAVAQTLAEKAIQTDLDNGGDHKTSYQHSKAAVQRFIEQLPGQRSELLLQ